MQCDANTLTVTYPAEPDSVALARHALTRFAATAGADDRQLESVRLAASEALTNAVLHAYRDTAGEVHVTAAHVADELWILVCDDGCGLEPRPDRPGLGLGLALISQVSEEMSVGPRAGGGTEVRMRFALVHANRTAPAVATSPDGITTSMRDVVGPAAQRVCGVDRRSRRPA